MEPWGLTSVKIEKDKIWRSGESIAFMLHRNLYFFKISKKHTINPLILTIRLIKLHYSVSLCPGKDLGITSWDVYHDTPQPLCSTIPFHFTPSCLLPSLLPLFASCLPPSLPYTFIECLPQVMSTPGQVRLCFWDHKTTMVCLVLSQWPRQWEDGFWDLRFPGRILPRSFSDAFGSL